MKRRGSLRLRSGAAVVVAMVVAGLAPCVLTPTPASAGVQHPGIVSQDPVDWTPHLAQLDGESLPFAYSIAEAGSSMVVGGDFQHVQNADRTTTIARTNVFAFDKVTGKIDDFSPVVDGPVWSVVSDGSSVYIGGQFRTVNGQPRPAIAKLDIATGRLDPSFKPPMTTGRITDMEIAGGRLFVSGTFGARLLALNPTTGTNTRFIRNSVTGRLANSDGAQVFKFDVSPGGDRLVAVGNFTEVDGSPRPRVFMLDLSGETATLTDWNYDSLGMNCTSQRAKTQAYVQDVDFSPDGSWFALVSFGYMYQDGYRGEMLCDSVARFETSDLDPERPTWINYTGGDSLKSVTVTGAAVYVQGHNRWLDNPYGKDSAGPGAVERLGGGAVDPQTGAALPWNPSMPAASGGYQMLATEQGLWLVTDGTWMRGEYHRGIRYVPIATEPEPNPEPAALVSTDPADWTPALAQPQGDGRPSAYAIERAGEQLVVGGQFQHVTSRDRSTVLPRANIFAFGRNDGAISEEFAPDVNGPVWAVVSDGTSVYLGGEFTTVNGVQRPAVAKVDLATGTVDESFAPPITGGRVSDLALVKGRLIVSGTFGARLLALNPNSGRNTRFIQNAITGKLPDSSRAEVFRFDVDYTGARLVAVGNFTQVDGAARPRAFMLDLSGTTATLSPWNYEYLGQPCSASAPASQAYLQDVNFAPDGRWFSFASGGGSAPDGGSGLMLCDSVSRFESNTMDPAMPTWVNYTGSGALRSVGVTSDVVYVQGQSRWLDNPEGDGAAGLGAVDRPGGGAVSAETGVALDWNPRMPAAVGGYQVLPTSAGVWFVTDGTWINDENRRGIRFLPGS